MDASKTTRNNTSIISDGRTLFGAVWNSNPPSSFEAPAALVPVASTKSLRQVATPSRKRRIIYETARRVTRQYINNAIQNVNCQMCASQRIQRSWCLYQFKKSYQKALFHIQGLYMIYRAKMILRQKRKQRDASKTLSKFVQQCITTRRLTLQAAIRIQKLWRGAMARSQAQEYKLSLLEIECSAIVIQSFIRTCMAKLAFAKRHHPPCAITIQRKYRSYLIQKRKKEKIMQIRNQATIKIMVWWKHMKFAQVLWNYAQEEIRLHNIKRENESNNDKTCDHEISADLDTSLPSCNSQVGVDDVDSPFNDDADFGEGKDNLVDSDTKTDSSLITNEDMDDSTTNSEDNEDLTVCSVSSKASQSSSDIRNQELKQAMELEYKRNQAGNTIQFYFKSYIHHLQQRRKKQQEEEARRQLQILREQSAAAVLTNELWILYQGFLQRREQIKREIEIKATVKIQASIRKFIAARFVGSYRKIIYSNILQTYQNQFWQYHHDNYGHDHQHKMRGNQQDNDKKVDDEDDLHDSKRNRSAATTTTGDEEDWMFSDLRLPPFLEECYNVHQEGKDDAEELIMTLEEEEDCGTINSRTNCNSTHPREVEYNGKGINTDCASTFHDDWIEMLPPSSKRLIPNGCNLHGIDHLIRCCTFDI